MFQKICFIKTYLYNHKNIFRMIVFKSNISLYIIILYNLYIYTLLSLYSNFSLNIDLNMYHHNIYIRIFQLDINLKLIL